jgi:hypothetical protein
MNDEAKDKNKDQIKDLPKRDSTRRKRRTSSVTPGQLIAGQVYNLL